MAEFKNGDVVLLKSSKKEMTVRSVNGDDIECSWLDSDDKRQVAVFKAHELQKKEPAPKPPKAGPGGSDGGVLNVNPKSSTA